MIEPYKKKTLLNLKKARGQMDRIVVMIHDDRYCIDIIQQCNAAIGMIRQASNFMLESHLHTCGKKIASPSRAESEKFIKEIIQAYNLTLRKK
ncbi:metal-sensing transcriptional repressor [Candidatus Uhrbacteria bacterium]|nr:metal-sensing transcriptional repressor [Candidatus Uhrbacteria bacterium]